MGNGQLIRRLSTVLVATVAVVTVPFAIAAPAQAADPDTVPCSETSTTCTVTLEDGINGCMGVRTTPGSENTDKRLVGGTLQPGGTAEFLITYPVDPDDADGRTTFVITDCVFVNDEPILKYTLSFVPNTAFTLLDFTLSIPSDVELGSTYCNYAKTTAAPSESQASNRKAGPACFVVGGDVRIEKVDADTSELLAGATFTVSCTPTTALPPTVINFVGATDAETVSYTNAGGPLAISVTDVATTGVITVNAPSGTPCTATETAAPEGYLLPDDPSQDFTTNANGVQTITFRDERAVGSLEITKNADAPGTFTFEVDCDGTEFDQTVEVTVGESGTATSTPIGDIPIGTECTVTEQPNPDFEVDGDAAQTITIESGTNTVTFTNVRKVGGLVISKTADAAGTFQFTVDCDGTDFDVDESDPITLTLTEAGTVSSDPITGIPTGTECTVTELPNDDFNADEVSITKTITDTEASTEFAFTNTRKVGSIVITKSSDTPGTFVFDISCDNGTETSATIEVGTAGDSVDGTPVTGIPTGTVCTVSEEPQDGFFPQPDQTVTIVEGVNAVSFANVGRTRGLDLVKAVSDDAAVAGDVLTYSFSLSTSGNSPQSDVVVTDEVPDGVTYVDGSAACDAPCVAAYDADTDTVTWSLGDLEPGVTVDGLSYDVTVDPVEADTTIRNTGVAASNEVGPTPSNEVITKVTLVLGEKTRKPPKAPEVLPFTGTTVPMVPLLAMAAVLSAAGVGLQVMGGRRRRYTARHAA
jgi:uncharacterized repeat protein (TIGR01451 family)